MARKQKKQLNITDAEALRRIWSVFAWLDEARWREADNYNLINYAQPAAELRPTEKILTHWLCYVTDRQMPFQYIWEVGGHVVSKIVREYCHSGKSSTESVVSHVRLKDDGKYCLQLDEGHQSPALDRRGVPNDGPVRFASRYLATDLACFVRTLVILELLADRDITKFVSVAAPRQLDGNGPLRWVAGALFGLCYQGSRQVSSGSLADPEKAMADAALGAREWAEAFRAEREKTVAESLRQLESKAFGGAKRLWCSVRDYAKSPEFRPEFAAGLTEAGDEVLAEWWRDDMRGPRARCGELELPGDVWNNAPVFRKCLVEQHTGPTPDNRTTSWLVRELHSQLFPGGRSDLYPEQFDVTFDFVPRMCSRKLCNVCFFGKNGIKDLCTGAVGKLCAPALVSCGYTMSCPGECEVSRNNAAGLCQTLR